MPLQCFATVHPTFFTVHLQCNLVSPSIFSFCEAKTVHLAEMWKPNKKEKKKKAEIEGKRAREFWNLELSLPLNLYFSLFLNV